MNEPPGYVRQPWPKTRQCARRPLEGRLLVHAPEGKVRGWLHDVCEEGVGGVVSAQLAEGVEVEIEFELNPSPQPPMKAQAIVRHSSGFRYGFQFVSLTPEQREEIRAYCAGAAESANGPRL
jgi:hypothetical protein